MLVERGADLQKLISEISELIWQADLFEDALKRYRQECDGYRHGCYDSSVFWNHTLIDQFAQ